MSNGESFIPKIHHQNGSIKVEVIQMTNDNVSDIVKWVSKPNIQVHRSIVRNIEIITIDIPGYAGVQHLRYKDFLIKYTNDKDISFLVVSEKQFHQRYESSNNTQSNQTSERYNPYGY